MKKKIYILTSDDHYYIIDHEFIAMFMPHIYGKGGLLNPVFLQSIESKYFSYVYDSIKGNVSKWEKKYKYIIDHNIAIGVCNTLGTDPSLLMGD